MKTACFFSMTILSVILCSTRLYSQDSIRYSERPNGHNSPYRIPINEILKNPDVYEGTHLQVVGYLHLDWEADAIYSKKSDLKNRHYKKGLWVHVNQFKFKHSSELKNRYVIIDAVFDANDHGSGHLWGGALKSITAIKAFKKYHRR